ncbi:hypothetical protein ACSBR1_039886 [Camellia fascicularis]
MGKAIHSSVLFGLEYDLDLFNIVAVPDFNIVMENSRLQGQIPVTLFSLPQLQTL